MDNRNSSKSYPSRSNSEGRISRRRFIGFSASAAAVAIVAGIGGYLAYQSTVQPVGVQSSPAATAPPAGVATLKPSQSLIDAAKKEGQVNFYSSFDEATVNILAEGFKRNYGIEVFPTGGEVQIKIMAEYRAGKHIADTYYGPASESIPAMDEGVMAQYDSPEGKAYPSNLKDPQGRWVISTYAPQTIAYNTNLVKGEDIPKSYWDLLKPRFKDKITVWEPLSGPHTLIISKKELIGEARWAEFVRGLSAQNPKVIRGTGPLITLLKTGEAEVGLWVYTGTLTTQMKEGAPVDYVRRKGTMIAAGSIVWLYKFAPHPNAARLLYDYLLSEEGQRRLNDRGTYVVTRPGIPPKMGVGIGTGEGVTPEMAATVWPYAAKDIDIISEEWKRLFQR